MKWNKSEQTHTDRSALNGAERSRAERNGRKRLRSQSLKDYMHTRSGTEWGMEWNGMEWNGMKQNETERNRMKQNETE